MKKHLLLLLLLIALLPIHTQAATNYYYNGSKAVKYTKGVYKAKFDNKLVTNNSTAPAMIITDNVMVPYRYALVTRGPKLKATYSNKKLTLTDGTTTVAMKLDVKSAVVTKKVNGKTTKKTEKLYTPMKKVKYKGKTLIYVPAKRLAAFFDYNYSYIKSQRTVYLSKKAVAKPATTEKKTETKPAETKPVEEKVGTQSTTLKGVSTSQFIRIMGPLAQENYKESGVLASVTLAQSILESGWGKSELAQKSNNMFGMKATISGNTWAGTVWDGKTETIVTTEEYGGKKVKITAKFRKYPDIERSIADHSAYLLNAKKSASTYRYAGLKNTTSYSKQISIIVNGGYCTWSSYRSQLVSLITKYKLTQYDKK